MSKVSRDTSQNTCSVNCSKAWFYCRTLSRKRTELPNLHIKWLVLVDRRKIWRFIVYVSWPPAGQTNKQQHPELRWRVWIEHAFRGWYLSSFRLYLIINPMHLFITLHHRNTQVISASLGINTQGIKCKIPLIFSSSLSCSAWMFVAQSRGSQKKSYLASVHLYLQNLLNQHIF